MEKQQKRKEKSAKLTRNTYPKEYKLEAVRLVMAGKNCRAVATSLGIPAQTLHNWVNAERAGELVDIKLNSDEIVYLRNYCTGRLDELHAQLKKRNDNRAQAECKMLEHLHKKLESLERMCAKMPDLRANPEKGPRPKRAKPPQDAVNRLLDAVIKKIKTKKRCRAIPCTGCLSKCHQQVAIWQSGNGKFHDDALA